MDDVYDVYVALERRIEGYEQIILEALTNSDYVDWLREPQVGGMSERLIRDIGSALRSAHEERLRAARVALRNLVDLREESAWMQVSDDEP